MTDIPLRILLQASRGNVLSVVGDVAKVLGSSGGLQGAMTALGVAAVGAGVAITALAVDKAKAFQNAMLQNVAHAGLAKNQFDAVSQSVLSMASDVGQMPTDLAQALYPILSGFSGISNESAKAQTSLEALRLSAEDVTGTTTKTTIASSALVSTFNALGLQSNNTATNIARLKTLNDQMEATVIAGNMHWEQYANVAGKLATAIKGTGVSWTEASAALSTMTNEGFSAQRSQTYLANLFTQLDIKTDSLAKNAKKLGVSYTYVQTSSKQLPDHFKIVGDRIERIPGQIEHLSKVVHGTMGLAFDEAKFRTMSLAQQIAYLNKITSEHGETQKQQQSELLKLLNGNATALKTYNALSTAMSSYKTNLDAIKNSHGATATAFATASSSFQASGQRMKAAIDVLLIDLGTQLLPYLSKFLDWLTPIIKKSADWIATSRDLHTWLANIGGFLQYELVPALNATWNAISTLVGWLQQSSGPATALRDILGGIVLAVSIQKIGGMTQDLIGFGSQAMSFVKDAGAKLLAFLTGDAGLKVAADEAGLSVATIGTDAEAASGKVTGLGTAVLGALGPLLLLAGVAKWISDNYNSIFNAISGNKGISITDIINAARKAGVPILGGQGQTSNPTPQGSPPALPPMRSSVPRYASGITDFSGGLAYVHGGEVLANLAPGTSVVPANRVNFGGGGIVVNLTVNNPMRSRADTANLIDEIEREIALRTRLQTPGLSFGGLV